MTFDIKQASKRIFFGQPRQRRIPQSSDHNPLDEVAALNSHTMTCITGPDALISSANARFLLTLGYEEAELVGQSPLNFYHPHDRDAYPEVNAMLEAGILWAGEVRMIHKAGHVVATQATILPRTRVAGKMMGAVVVMTDITAQRADAAMRGTVASLHRLSEPIYMVCAETMKIAYANAAAIELFNWNPLNLNEMTANHIDLVCDHAEIEQKIGQLRSGEVDQITFDAEKNGVYYQSSAQLIKPDVGDARFFVMLRDCSDERTLMRAKESFISTVSHELRTPLTSIKGALGLLLSGAAGPMNDKFDNLIQIAHRNADRLVLIVNDILDLEKLAAGKMDYDLRTMDLRDAVADACSANQPFADELNVTIVNKTADLDASHPAMANYDDSRIHQVLTNLLSNACKFSTPGREISVSIAQLDGVHAVSVTDHGQGIPADALETIFERFTQVASSPRSKIGGTGLGLSIVKAIVESHGGQVTIHSSQGYGTTVTFTLKNVDMRGSAIEDIA